MKKLINPKPTGYFVQAALNIMFNPNITSNAKVIYSYLMAQDSSYIPNYRDIEVKTGISNSSIQRAFIELKTIGVVVINRLPGRNNYQYVVNSDVDLTTNKTSTKTTTEAPKSIKKEVVVEATIEPIIVKPETAPEIEVETEDDDVLSLEEEYGAKELNEIEELFNNMPDRRKEESVDEVFVNMVLLNEKTLSSILGVFLTNKLLKKEPKGKYYGDVITKLNEWLEYKTWDGVKDGEITKEMFSQLKEAAIDIKLNN